jgi:hypothetical protein
LKPLKQNDEARETAPDKLLHVTCIGKKGVCRMPATLIKTSFKAYFSILSTGLIFFLLAQTPPAVKAAGEIDPSFNAGVLRQPRGSATTVVTQPDGKILIGGSFEVVSGFLRNLIAVRYDNTPKVGLVRLLNDIATRVRPLEYDTDRKANR